MPGARRRRVRSEKLGPAVTGLAVGEAVFGTLPESGFGAFAE